MNYVGCPRENQYSTLEFTKRLLGFLNQWIGIPLFVKGITNFW
jgi:hypothetical protein